MIYSFDPGRITGIAVGTKEGKLEGIYQHTIDGLHGFLFGLDEAEVFIIENFTIRPSKAASFIWSDMEVIQVIGALKYVAYELEAKVEIQEPTVKNIGYRWAGIVPPSNHKLSHEADAYAHLVFYWVKRLGLTPPAVTTRMKNEQQEDANTKGQGAIGRSLGDSTPGTSTDGD